MNKLVAFFIFTFTCGSLIGFTSEGAFALITTSLVAEIDEEQTVIPVTSVDGFLTNHFIILGNEVIGYTNTTTNCPSPFTTAPACFTGATRGDRESSAAAHRIDTRVYNQPTGVVNQIVGFNVVQQMSAVGIVQLALQLPISFGVAFVKVLIWDFSFLEGPYVFFKYVVLYPLSGGFIWSIYILFSQSITSLFLRR